MAMTSSGMKAAIKTEMSNQGFDIDNVVNDGQADKYIEAIATAIVTYIQSNAEADDTGTTGTPAGKWPIL